MVRRFTIAAAVVMLAWCAGLGTAAAQQPGAAPAQQPAMADMMKMHEQMMAEMKTARAKLDALVREMNAASGNQKVDATAAVVNELARQHSAMFDRMEQMHGMMMSGRGMRGGPGATRGQ